MKIDFYGLCTIACWFLFALFWILLRNRVKKDINEQTKEQKILAISGFAVYFILLYWPLFFTAPSNTFQSETTGLIGLSICVIGVLLSIWSRLVLGKDWSGGVAIKVSHDLITRGPYNVVRHPIYTGFILGLLGSAIAVGHWSGFIAVVLVLLGLVAKIGQEEKILSAKFPGDYESYQLRSKKLIPFIW